MSAGHKCKLELELKLELKLELTPARSRSVQVQVHGEFLKFTLMVSQGAKSPGYGS